VPSGLSSCFGSVATPSAALASHTINIMLKQRDLEPGFSFKASARLIDTATLHQQFARRSGMLLCSTVGVSFFQGDFDRPWEKTRNIAPRLRTE
jgi:hypothetical protein